MKSKVLPAKLAALSSKKVDHASLLCFRRQIVS
jgi:hypothetical protein